MSTFKRIKRDTVLNKTLDSLLVDRKALIPPLARDNEPLQSTAHTENTGHEDATPLREDEFDGIQSVDVSMLLDGVSIYAEYDDTAPSLLLSVLHSSLAFVYQNETQIQRYVMLAMEDALIAMDLRDFLEVQPEISVFSYRPDIIVVSHSTLGIILVVEVKKPGKDVFTSHSVAGQVYDYLVGMLGMGITCPMVVLTTYEEMVIAHLNDGGHARTLMEEVAGQMEQPLKSEIEFLKGDATGEEHETPGSPLSRRNLVVSTPQDDVASTTAKQRAGGRDSDDDLDDDGSDDSDWNRCVCYSKVVERGGVFKAWMFAIRCAVQACIRSPPFDIPLQGSTPSFACARVNEMGMVWGDLPSDLKIDYFTTPKKATESFYLLSDLGRGSNGRAYLVCTSSGKACVAKFYFIKDDEAHRVRVSAWLRQEQRKILLEERKAEAVQEKNYWSTFYEGKYDVEVRQLHGHWCLLLPYFDPITDVQSRHACLPQVRRILERFKSKNLKYKDDDLRWRHVGIRNGEIALFDLGSLETPEEGTSIDVDVQIQILKERINIC